jgi:hypothetical protein
MDMQTLVSCGVCMIVWRGLNQMHLGKRSYVDTCIRVKLKGLT